jgi:hypothetical protein
MNFSVIFSFKKDYYLPHIYLATSKYETAFIKVKDKSNIRI